ncbi:hypothetical protein PG993_012953 [Apiospora rasikravindrae]|uniref:S1 motif domain-containing protein n=1 Tax=Apiospora rasikravindrae TaxID=990691 RepID=A0ABR1RWB0_9PEZI
MSSLKRKDAPGGSSAATAKAVKTHGDARPSKATAGDKNSKSQSKPTTKPATSADSKPAAPKLTKLKEEEPLFPRGGGSVLTPLEQKQIQVQARQDVLFEQESSAGQKAAKAVKKKKSKGQLKDSKQTKAAADDEDTVRIESLNYKRLIKGSLVLAQVTEVNPLDVALALPNNLVGHVSITAISDALNERISAEAAGDEDEDEESQDSGVDLKSLFAVGQYLRAYVTSTVDESSEASGKPRRHIEMSLRPQHTNTGMSNQDLVANATVMATVVSVEDHGFVMDLGLDDLKQAFLSRKELDKAIPEESMQPGNVLLCQVLKKSGNVTQLTTMKEKIGQVQNVPSDATTINTFLPGTAVELMVNEISGRGLAGKVMGSLDVTADLIHSGAGPQAVDLEEKYKVGKKVKARVICNFPTSEDPKLGISMLDHVTKLRPKTVDGSSSKSPLDALSISALVEECTVTKVEPEVGVFVEIGVKGVPGFVHISRLKDGKVDMLSQTTGPYRLGSVNKGRVVGYNPMDGMFQLSFEKQILDQPFLRVQDVPVGGIVNGVIEKLIVGQNGVDGLLVKIAEGISGLVPEMHLADIKLQHPEKKFREGQKVKARVLSTDPVKRHIRLTLKKTLLNSEAVPLKSFDQVVVGMQAPATIINVLPKGAIVQFYGSLRGFLPVSEMSEAYIRDPKEHFRVGQVVHVHVLNFDAEAHKLYVSCKDPSAFGVEKQRALLDLSIGTVVSAKVVQKTEDHIFVELVGSSLKAMLSAGHLTDGSSKKNQSTLKKLHVGQTVSDLVVIEKNEEKRFIGLSKKPSLVKAAQDGNLLTSFEDAKVGQLRQGFVRHITVTAIFVQFAGQLTALLPKSRLPQAAQKVTDFGMEKNQSLQVQITSVDNDYRRIVVGLPSTEKEEKKTKDTKEKDGPAISAENPVDTSITTLDDIVVGMVTKARIASIKNTQLNVRLADNIQGRVDVSQVFDNFEEIENKKSPLSKFKQNQVISVKILGVHDAKNHRFLPISHRSTHSVLELSAKPSDLKDDSPEQLSYETVKAESTHVAFVNNIQERALWVSLSPNVRGRIKFLEISDDVAMLESLPKNYPVGTALLVKVLSVDQSLGRLELSALSSTSRSSLRVDWKRIKKDWVLPARVTKVTDRQVMVHLSDAVAGPIHLPDISDDYDEANPSSFEKNRIIQVSVVSLDKPNKKLRLSTRKSRILNRHTEVKDREITQTSQLNVGEIIRGFVKNVSDKGLFINLGGDIVAMVRVSDLSDSYLKEWKDSFQVDQVVKGRIVSIDPATGHIQMSLKASVVDKDYTPVLNLRDFRQGQIVTGTIRKVEEFGAFILVDGSANVSGLCHRSEMAENPVEDARKLFSEGDAVKAVVLKLDLEKKRINFGLKPSYFVDEDEDTDMSDEDDVGGAAVALMDLSDDDDMDEDGSDDGAEDSDEEEDEDEDDDEDEDEDEDEDVVMGDGDADEMEGLDAGGFDWDTNALNKRNGAATATDEDAAADKKKKRRKAQVEVDKSGDLDAFGPRSAADYEQLLNRRPNSSSLWIEYMAKLLQSSDVAGARKVAERAISTINSTEETEKLNAWTAYLNLEVKFGTDETVDEVFKRALHVNDQQEVYQRAATIYIQEGKSDKVNELFQALVKKFGGKSPEVWLNYGQWLHSTRNDPEGCHALMARAAQALPAHAQLPLMTKFAALEFTSKHSNPELGRTMFEGLLSSYPKRFDLWNQLLDLETSGANAKNPDKAVVRDVFERGVRSKGLKPKQVLKWFKRWNEWEEKHGDKRSKEMVAAKAKEYVKKAEASKAAAANGDDE